MERCHTEKYTDPKHRCRGWGRFNKDDANIAHFFSGRPDREKNSSLNAHKYRKSRNLALIPLR